MSKAKNILLIFVLSFSVLGSVRAQLSAIGYLEFGYSIHKYKSDELQDFLSSYNAVNNPASPFKMKIGAAKGTYLKFGLGIGGVTKMVLDFTIYKGESNPLEARFANGSGRDIWFSVRNSNTNVGIRFGGTEDIPVWLQLNMNIGIQYITLNSAFVFPDGSRSLGYDHGLNGCYTDFNMVGAFGVAGGFRIVGPLAVTAAMDYFGRGLDYRKHPEYHIYSNNNDIGGSDYFPRNVTNGAGSLDNSLSNDFRGFQFTFGVVCLLSSKE